jgi:predicted nuclease with TOPRIM domain
MIQKELVDIYSKYEELKVVHSGEVHDLTMDGWKLIAVMGAENIEPEYIEHAQYVPGHKDEYGSYVSAQWQKTSISKERAVKILLFLMGLERNAVTERLRGQLEDAHRANENANKTIDDIVREKIKLEKEIKVLNAQVDSQQHSYSSLSSELQTKSEILNRMEEDMAKITKAFGELEVKKVLQGLNDV